MKAQWTAEKDAIQKIQAKKAQLEQLRTEAEQATRRGDLQKAAEISYGRIPAVEREITEIEKRLAEVQKKAKYLKQEVDADDIAEIVSKWTGIPVSKMLESERERLTHLEGELARRVIGQPEALAAVANAVRRARAGLQDPHRPTGSFIFLGPTGVGKTETAKALAEFLFDDERALVRLDMSENMEKHAVARMIGAPPGYVGYEEGGQLTEAIRRRPYRSEEHTSELQSQSNLVCRLLLEKKKVYKPIRSARIRRNTMDAPVDIIFVYCLCLVTVSLQGRRHSVQLCAICDVLAPRRIPSRA